MSTTTSNPPRERRVHARHPLHLGAHCARLGRPDPGQPVDVIDLSLGGIRVAGPHGLRVGEVVQLTVPRDGPGVDLTGLVVAVTAPSREGTWGQGAQGRNSARAHIAFTRLTPSKLEQVGRLIDAVEQRRGQAPGQP